MRQVTYTMHFRGKASRSGEDGKTLRTTSSGTSCTIETTVGPDGVHSILHPAEGGMAFLESEAHFTASDSFEGKGVLVFGEESTHALRFSTVNAGHFGPSVAPGLMAGTVSWRIEGGEGRFQAATGLIAAAFTLSETGDLSEYQCGLIFVPE